MDKDFCICFDLNLNKEIKHFLPIPYIASLNKNKIEYIQKKANTSDFKSFNIIENETLKALLEICEELKTENLTKKFNSKNKKPKDLQKLLEDPSVIIILNQFLSFKSQKFFELVRKEKVPLAINMNREDAFYKFQTTFSENHLYPILHFKKLEDKIIYTLSLKIDNTPFFPSEKNTILLLNTPGWIAVDQTIYELKELNGNKITPFLKKKSIEIPEKTSVTYFKTFIKSIANKVEIESEGFEMQQINKLTKCSIKPIFYFMADAYYLDVIFHYGEFSFSYNDKIKFRSRLNIADKITIEQVKRDLELEKKWLTKLTELGLIKQDNEFWSFKNRLDNKYQNLQLLFENKKSFLNNQIEIEVFQIENKTIINEFGTYTINHEEKEDWFDLNIIINCGKFIIAFTDIIPNLKTNNPFYQLSDGTYFLIPNEWFSQFKSIVEFAKIKNDQLILNKNQFTLLNEMVPETIYSKQESIEYSPSTNLKATLRNYQLEGVKWLLEHFHNNLGACLADDMGLGKTLQTLALLMYLKDNLKTSTEIEIRDLFSDIEEKTETLKTLIIAPSSLLFNWKNEINKFCPSFTVVEYIGKERASYKNKLQLYDVVLTSYAIALKDIGTLKSYEFRYLIVDESQYIKNKNSKIFTALHSINTANKISLSGTPIENSLDDLWSQMQFINPDLLGDYPFFQKYFKYPIEKQLDNIKTEELKKLINPYILRRTKTQVAKDLPPYSEQIFYTEMSKEQKIIYEKEKSIARNSLLNISAEQSLNKINVLNILMKLRQIANHPLIENKNYSYDAGKFIDVIAYLETLIKSKKKVLIFSSFVQHLKIYTDWCASQKHKFCLLSGETKRELRENQVNEFQNDPDTLLFFISLKAGGVGLNLTQASYVLILDPWWNPFAENQAIARAHRIGQKNQVNVIRFIAKDSIEEKILTLQEKKKNISDSMLEVNTIPAEIEEQLAYILE